jgi:probable biosynthetic protein (TIGR04098 family)
MTVLRRDYQINMPQMAMGGLSESWLFKEMGDLHWGLITQGLGEPSSQLSDANGARLYATFTRIRFSSTVPLTGFRENDHLAATGRISRYGGSYFFSELEFKAGDRVIQAQLMSTFTKRAAEGSNAALLKGQPVIRADCTIPALDAQPAFAAAMREHRAANERESHFETDYTLQPNYDVNGVNLLYFAAYPMIADLCEARSHDDPVGWHIGRSVVLRDVFYAGNCDVHDQIVYRRHASENDGTTQASLSRRSDGRLMGFVITKVAAA